MSRAFGKSKYGLSRITSSAGPRGDQDGRFILPRPLVWFSILATPMALLGMVALSCHFGIGA